MQKSVVLGISGGVDSAVAAYLLKKQGYEITAVFLSMHGFSASSFNDASNICKSLEIPIVKIDASEEFKKVTDYFVSEYKSGKTPNPCVFCNANVKMRLLKDYATSNGIDLIASGHYCEKGFEKGRYFIKQTDSKKDQAYMLAKLPQDIIESVIFPLSGMDKDTVRKIAAEAGISVANKPDSQEICFIPDNDHVSYIENIIGKSSDGDFYLEDEDKIIGKHKGIINYTVGQRKRLGIAYGVPLTVKKIDAVNNVVTVTKSPSVLFKAVKIANINYQKLETVNDSLECRVKLRYSAKPVMCKVSLVNNELYCEFNENAAFAAIGQTAVFYDEGESIVFSGDISEAYYA